MRKALLAVCAVLLLASFANDTSNKTILQDIDGTLLQSFVVVDNNEKTVTFETDANTTVSSSVIDGEFKIFLIENGTSGTTVSHTLELEEMRALSFDHYFETAYDTASSEEMFTSRMIIKKGKPRTIIQ